MPLDRRSTGPVMIPGEIISTITSKTAIRTNEAKNLKTFVDVAEKLRFDIIITLSI
jgi:hypothetical protein